MRIPGIPFVQGRNRYSDGDARKYGIAIHNTSNDASDSGEASYATWRPDGVSSHLYADHDSVTQSIDTRDRAGHAGSTHGNDNGISVEITGANGWSRAKWLSSVAWDKLGAVLATVIEHHWPDGSFQVRRASVAEMRRNPRVKALYGHDDMRRAWGGTDHTDPGPNFPWDRLIKAINDHLGEDDMEPKDMLDAKVDMVDEKTGKRWSYGQVAGKDSTTVRGTLGAAYGAYYYLRNVVRPELLAAKKRDEAILAAVAGDDTATILARIDQRSAEEAARDEQAEAERAELAELIRQVQSGEVEAAAVVDEIGRRLGGAEPADTGP